MKQCRVCSERKPLSAFNRQSRSIDGHRTECRSCQSSYNSQRYEASADLFKAKVKSYQAENADAVSKRKKEKYLQNREAVLAKCAKYQRENREERNLYRRGYAKKNPSLEKVYARNYASRNKPRLAERSRRRQASKLSAVPSWANVVATRDFYEKAKELTALMGVRWHVDHIVPLISPLVCGLHWHGNLQLLPATVNLSKGNRTWPDMPL